MIAWKINRIPTIQTGAETNGRPNQFMRQILFSMHSCGGSNACLELVFYHRTGEEISVYIFLRNVPAGGVISSIEMQLTAANYQFQRLDSRQMFEISQQITAAACAEMHAVVKTEKIVMTPFMQEGYYYWADPLLRDESREMDNFTMLFQALQNCDNSFVSFQLMPTQVQGYESDVLQYLNTQLEQRVRHAVPVGYGMTAFEPYAQPAYDAYRHYAEKRGQPVFQYNIVVGSMTGSSAFLANQVISTVKANAVNAPELQVFPVQMAGGSFTYETFPLYLSGLLQRQYRDMFIWGGGLMPPNPLFRLPYLLTAEEALMFFRLPYDDGRIVGIKSSAYRSSNELLNQAVTDPGNVIFGTSAGMADTPIGAAAKDFAQHALIVGMPGTGKTTFCLNLLLQFHKKGIPFLAIEPTKAEYRALIDAIPDLQIFTPGNNELCPFIMNPFVPPRGIPVERYVSSLDSAFKAAFSMPPPLDVMFPKAIREAYRRYGWRDYSRTGDPNVTLFGFHEFITVFKDMVESSNYDRERKGNLQSMGVFRLSNLIEQNRNVFDTIHTIPIEDILQKPTIIELNAIDDVERKALLMAILLVNVAAYTKATQQDDSAYTSLRNAILLDEAHVLLDQRSGGSEDKIGAQNYAVQLVENLIAEIRSYATSIIIADQRPSAVGGPIRANTDIKITFRLTEKCEKDLIADNTDMDDSMRQQLSQLEKGQAFAYYHRLAKPQLVITPDIRARERIRVKVSDEEIWQRSRYWDHKAHLLKPHLMCGLCPCENGCNSRLRADADYYCRLIWDEKKGMFQDKQKIAVQDKQKSEIQDKQKLMSLARGVPILLGKRLLQYSEKDRAVLLACVRIALIRKAEMEKNIKLNPANVKLVFEDT